MRKNAAIQVHEAGYEKMRPVPQKAGIRVPRPNLWNGVRRNIRSKRICEVVNSVVRSRAEIADKMNRKFIRAE